MKIVLKKKNKMHSFEEINKKDEKTLDVFLYKIKMKKRLMFFYIKSR